MIKFNVGFSVSFQSAGKFVGTPDAAALEAWDPALARFPAAGVPALAWDGAVEGALVPPRAPRRPRH